MAATPFGRLAQLGEQLEQTTKRLELTALVAAFLRELAPDEIAPAVQMAIGQVFPEWDGRTLNVAWQSAMGVLDRLVDATPELRNRVGQQAVDGGQYVGGLLEAARTAPPAPPPLGLLEVYDFLEQIASAAGRGSRAAKDALLYGLFARATAPEARSLTGILFSEMRHGVSEGIMLDAIAQAGGVRPALVRRAYQFLPRLGEVARVALVEGEAGLRRTSVQVFLPVKPMLAQTAERMEEAFERYGGRLALEYKLDGARVQVHRRGDEVRLYSRSLADVTASLPDLAEEVRQGLRAQEAILDGEAIAVSADGRPLPFQDLMRRFRRKHGVDRTTQEVFAQLHLFDLLYADGELLVDAPAEQRWAALEQAAGDLRLVRRCLPRSLTEAQAFAEEAYHDGHEGVMAKDLDSPYTPGVRGRPWLKLKHVLSLDLVVIAADWGYGRRHGWLSNYHLGARDEESGNYVLVGKTFKGLTDEEFRDMTGRLLALETTHARGTVTVRPEVVVEVLFNEIQSSPNYQSGLALRFARIARIREDKPAAEADTLHWVRQLYERQFQFKGRRT